MRELLALKEQPDRSCAEVDEITRCHLRNIHRSIAQLAALPRDRQSHLIVNLSAFAFARGPAGDWAGAHAVRIERAGA